MARVRLIDRLAEDAGFSVDSAAEASLWNTQHFLIATTMLVMGLFAVLSWDSTFLDRRDVLVLAPLPVRPRMIFLVAPA